MEAIPHFKRKVTLADVAAQAGISRAVAGQVLNGGKGNTRYGAAAERAVRKAAKELGYQPNYAARQLRGKKSLTFGILVASAGDPLRSFLVQYLDAEAVKVGYRTLLANTIGNETIGPDQFEKQVNEFTRCGVDGVVCAVHRWFPGDREDLARRHPNTVFYEDPRINGATYVTVNRAAAARLAVAHLAERGRRRIGLAIMSAELPTGAARISGYREALAEFGLPFDESLVFDGAPHGLAFGVFDETRRQWKFPSEIIDRAIEHLIEKGHADAVVAQDDFWAAELIRRLRRRGIEVPRDVAVVGYWNHYLADWTDPPLTTIDPNQWTAAKTIIRLLQERVEHPERGNHGESRTFEIEPELVVRASA